ncbi:MAG: GIY-YIG nuclease family protein, partial [Atopostipes sp.]|nr:GIY-YIG nuclease family protein [Atopostipes sp.]
MAKSKKSYFYVLYCKDRSLYAGYTTNLKRREKEHNSGDGAKYTRPASRRPLKMIYAESYQTRSEATKAEAAFKK